MSYIITKNGNNIARMQITQYTVKDFIGKINKVWGGRSVPTCPLVFDSIEDAAAYKSRNGIESWEITPYDPCLNTIL